MGFRTKIDFSNNRQAKQRIETITVLSGGTSFGVPFNLLPTGADLSTAVPFESYTGIVSQFSGDGISNIFTWGDPRMSLAEPFVTPITPSNSGESQTLNSYSAITSTIIDGNTVNLTYTGVSFDIFVSYFEDLGGGNYSGEVTSNNFNVSTANGLDFTGRTIWNDVSGITRTDRLIVSNNPQLNYVLTCIDTEGMASWSPPSVFTGNTSATCITDIYVTNLYGCSPLHIDPTGLNDVYIVENGGNVGIGTTSPTSKLHVSGNTFIDGNVDIIGNVNIVGSATTINTQTVQSKDNKILLNYSGNNLTAIGGGLEVLSAKTNGNSVELITDVNGDWNSNTGLNITGRTDDNTSYGLTIKNSGGTDTFVVRNDGNIGIGVNNPTEKLHVSGNTKISGNLVIDSIGSGVSLINLGLDSSGNVVTGTTGSTTYWSASTGADAIVVKNSNSIASGILALAEGSNTTAGGDYSHAEGYATKATGNTSHAEGQNTTAGGARSHAEGQDTTASGNFGSHSEGIGTTASGGFGSHAEGFTTTAVGGSSHSEGSSTTAIGGSSHAEGDTTTASGNYSHAEGINTIAIGQSAHAEGQYATASGNHSHAEGYGSTAIGDSSHAEGGYSALGLPLGRGGTAIGIGSHAEGNQASAVGNHSHAEGAQTTASGYASHAEGRLTTSIGQHSHSEGYLTTAILDYSHSEGISTVSGGLFGSHAEGNGSVASGQSSHAEGAYSTAIGNWSHSEGRYTTASGASSHAEGWFTVARGDYSHSEGFITTASGASSHAEGYLTTAIGQYSHAEGQQTTASGESSHAEGYTTNALSFYSHSEGYLTYAYGVSSHAEGQQTTARANYSHSEGWFTIASGQSAHAEGFYSTAIGNGSHAEGVRTTSIGVASHAEGSGTTAIGDYSHAEGFQTIASGTNSHAEGNITTASAVASHAEGRLTLALGVGSHAEGNQTTASGLYSHAEGQGTIASGQSAHAEGRNSKAFNYPSHAEGNTTTAIGSGSHSEGELTIASGDASHAEGSLTTAIGIRSHSEGRQTTAIGDNSHTEGELTTTIGDNSHAGGYLTIAQGKNSFVHGSGSTAQGTSTIVLGTNITGSSNDTTYVDSLNIKTVGAGPGTIDLGRDANGNVVNNASDISLKENINEIDSPLNKIKNLRGVYYNWKDKEAGGSDRKIGFIAQEVESIVPELVYTHNDGLKVVHYKDVTALLVEAIKELSTGTTSQGNAYLETQTILAEDNNIDLNYNGTPQTALGGGIRVLHAKGQDMPSELITDENGDFFTNTDFKPNSLTIPYYTPVSSSDSFGSEGNITRDDNFLYVKTSTGWKRSNLESF